jgi:hypothetical protein
MPNLEFATTSVASFGRYIDTIIQSARQTRSIDPSQGYQQRLFHLNLYQSYSSRIKWLKILRNHPLRRPPRINFLFTDLPKFVDSWSITSDHALGHLNPSTHDVLSCDSICRRLGSDTNDTNARVFWASIMLSITKISQPNFEGWRVVLLDHKTVSDDLRSAGYRGPFARAVEERNIDVRIGLNIISLARLSVCVEDEVNAVFLSLGQSLSHRCGNAELTLAAIAMQRETSAPEDLTRVVIMPNLQESAKAVRPSTFSLIETSSIFLAL